MSSIEALKIKSPSDFDVVGVAVRLARDTNNAVFKIDRRDAIASKACRRSHRGYGFMANRGGGTGLRINVPTTSAPINPSTPATHNTTLNPVTKARVASG